MATVVAISRQFGSGGARIGRAVAQRLGFSYADREILAEAARALDLQPSDLEPLEEHTTGFWARVGLMFAHGSPDTPYMPPALPAITEAQVATVEQQVIATMAARGRVVIVGRGAVHVLPKAADVLRVFLHAPLEARIDIAIAEYGFASRDEAEAVVRESDRARAAFARSLSGHDWCDATLYDVCLDTSAVGLERAAETIVDLVSRPASFTLPPIEPRTADNREAR